MYLQQLYRQHKGWFVIVVLFIVCQLFINFKRGVAFTPFFHYGMYAAPMQKNDSVPVATIQVNGKSLQPFSYAAQEWDKLVQPIYLESVVLESNKKLYDRDIKRLLAKIGIASNEAYFKVNGKVDQYFTNWYKPYASQVLKDSIQELSLNKHSYTLQNILDSFNTH